MLHHKSVKNLVIKDFEIIEEKLEKVEIALKKIARDLGENECESIFILEKKSNIKIEPREVWELRGRDIWIWVDLPYNKDNFELVKKKISKLDIPLLEYIKIINILKQKFIKYPEKVESCRINKEIHGLLKEMHGISSSYLTYYEWEQIQNSETWIKAQIEVTREFIAYKLLNKLKTKPH